MTMRWMMLIFFVSLLAGVLAFQCGYRQDRKTHEHCMAVVDKVTKECVKSLDDAGRRYRKATREPGGRMVKERSSRPKP